MSESSPEATQRPIRGCQLFRSRGVAAHTAAFVVGAALWFAAYLAVVSVAGWTDLVAADGATAGRARLFAGAAAGIVTGLYFAFAYTRALGSPMLNLLFPWVFTVLAPARVYALFAGSPDPLFASGTVVVAAALAAPGGAALLAVIAWYRYRFGSMANGKSWEDDHFPPGFRLAEASSGGGVDWENADYGLRSHEGSFVGTGYKHGFVVTALVVATVAVLFAVERLLGSSPAVAVLLDSPWVLVFGIGLGYVAWLNRRWRSRAGV
ncbi:hypothetical protein M0R89_04220 [Halorussus limi]|uniref:Uncharacterized protein n=1 Tax=Halorussus limi TaxID=2938695 RepID=A0A8U0HWH9_9EURY|nr:hypothetical protein [Halorussus limi]UPV75277.1 hypothetical protein M0R89_04220 [Halorussus limi]